MPASRGPSKIRRFAPRGRPAVPQLDKLSANCGQSRPLKHPPGITCVRGTFMTYRIVAERDNETVRMDRMSSLMAVAKAGAWASEGSEVTIIVRDGDELAEHQSDRLLLV